MNIFPKEKLTKHKIQKKDLDFDCKIEIESTGYLGKGVEETKAEHCGFLIEYFYRNNAIDEDDILKLFKKAVKKLYDQ